MASPKRLRGLVKFYTVHKPNEHSAHTLDGDVLIPAKLTEIDLVRALNEAGIDLKHYNSDSKGDEKFLVTNWSRP